MCKEWLRGTMKVCLPNHSPNMAENQSPNQMSAANSLENNSQVTFHGNKSTISISRIFNKTFQC